MLINKNVRLKKLVIILLVITFGGQIPAQAQDGAMVWPQREPASKNSNICVPGNIATTKDVYNAPDPAKTIINIQDAHASLSAQESIVSILDSLVTNYDLKIVAIEGSSGYIDTSILRTFPDEKIRRETAKYLMAKSRISAGEFFSITSDKPIALYGIEEKPLYNTNLEQFRSVCEINRSTEADMKGLLAVLKALQNKVYSKELIALDSNPALNKDGKISFRVRLEMANSLAAKTGVDHKRYRNLSKLAEALKMERGINFDKANKERDALVDVLGKELAERDLEELISKSFLFKSGKISKSEYYLFLQEMARKCAIGPEPYKDLIGYTHYITLYESIDLPEIFTEFEGFEDSVKEKLFKNYDERKLYNFSKCVSYIKDLFEMKLTGADLERLEGYLSSYDAETLSSFIKDVSARYGVTPVRGYDISRIFENIPEAMEFYRTADKRNSVMLSNTIKRMSEEGQSVGAIITGGYHTKGLTEILRQKETSYLVVLPKFDASKGERPYAAILTNKNGSSGESYTSGQQNLALGSCFEGTLPEAELLNLARITMAQVIGRDLGVEAAVQRVDQKKGRLTKVDKARIELAIEMWIERYEADYADGIWKEIKDYEPMSPYKFRQSLSKFKTAFIRELSRRLIIFDLDGTLYRSPTLMHTYRETVYHLLEVKGVPRSEMDKRTREMGGATSAAESLGITISEITAYNIANIDVRKFGITPNPKIKNHLMRLRSQDYDLVVLTDNNSVHALQIIDMLGLDGVFTRIFSTEDLGAPKPSPHAFKEVLRIMGVDPGNAFSVGDSRRKDVDPAIALGMKGIEIKGPEDLAYNLFVKLREAEGLIKRPIKDAETQALDTRFEELISVFRSSRPYSRYNIIDSAYKLAKKIYGFNKFEGSDEPYISHALDVGMTLARWGADEYTIAAALLHKIPPTESALKSAFEGNRKLKNSPIEKMIVNLYRTSRIIYKWPIRGKRTIQNYMNMIVKLTGSIENFRLLLADKLNSIPKAATQEEKEYRFREIRHIYAPLAERLGLLDAASELRDKAFKFTHPEEYAKTIDGMRSALGGIDPVDEAPGLLEGIRQEIFAALRENGIEAEVQSRRKGIYSSWEKGMSDRKPEYTIDLLEDILGLKIITEYVKGAERVINDIWRSASKMVEVKKITSDIMDRLEKGYDATHLRILCDSFVPYGREFGMEVMIMTGEDEKAYQFGIQSVKLQKPPVPHWMYKLKAEEDLRKTKIKQTFDLEHYPVLIGDPDARFHDWLTFLKEWEYVSFITTEMRKGEVEIVGMKVVRVPTGALPVDMAAHPGIDSLDEHYRGFEQLDVTRHAEYALDLEYAEKTTLKEDVPLFTGQFMTLIKDPKIKPIFSKDNFDKSYSAVANSIKYYRTKLSLTLIRLFNRTRNSQEVKQRFNGWIKSGRDTVAKLETSQSRAAGKKIDISYDLQSLADWLRLYSVNELYACISLGYITMNDIAAYLLSKKVPHFDVTRGQKEYRALERPGFVWVGISLTTAAILAVAVEPILGLKLGFLTASLRILSGAVYSNLNRERGPPSADERPVLERRLENIVNAIDPKLNITIVEDEVQAGPIRLYGNKISIRRSAARAGRPALIYAIAHEAGEANLPAFLREEIREIAANISILPYAIKYLYRRIFPVKQKAPVLPHAVFAPHSREDLIAILKVADSDIPAIEAADIDNDLKKAFLETAREGGAPARALFVRNMVERRKADIAGVYNRDVDSAIEKASRREDRIAVATTEKIAMNDPYTFDNMELSAKSGVQNVFIYGDILKSEEKARAYVMACGYKGNINDIKFVSKSGRSREELIKAAGKAAGIIPNAGNIGIRAAEGELPASEYGSGVSGILLEIPEITVNGYKLYAAINSYQILLGIMTQFKDGIALEVVTIPGVTYDKLRMIFRYLPKVTPMDYGKEIEVYRRAMEYVRSAA